MSIFVFVKNYPSKRVLKALGKNIRKLRQEQKLSQSQLAFECDIPRKQIIRIEKGAINTSIVNLLAISKALYTDIKNFFDFEY